MLLKNSTTIMADDEVAPTPVEQSQNYNVEEAEERSSNGSKGVPIQEIRYMQNSFYTIVKPVFLTMLLSALAVIFVRTPESAASGEASLSNSYTVLKGSDEDSSATRFGQSLVNGLVIVSVICAMTFCIVLLYKYRCMKCLIGYMIVSSTLLLGFLASLMFQVAIDRYQLKVDKATFYLTMWNFSIVGVISIFAPAGVVPIYVGQWYLILTSVIVAWQLSHFEEWTAWVLLVLLALYDLFAVLTPCGPLKALVNLMTADDAPNMPGLLYEASLPQEQRGTTQRQSSNGVHQGATESSATADTEEPAATAASGNATMLPDDTQMPLRTEGGDTEEPAPAAASDNADLLPDDTPHLPLRAESGAANEPANLTPEQESIDPDCSPLSAFADLMTSLPAAPKVRTPPLPDTVSQIVASSSDEAETPTTQTDTSANAEPPNPETIDPERIGRIPAGLAKIYSLPFKNDPQPPWITGEGAPLTAEQLCGVVEVVFPSNGGRIVPTVTLNTPSADLIRRTQGTEETRYTMISYRGEHRRVLFVNRQGRVMEDVRERNIAEERKERTHIKLGLGDFIFYSILVSKAALYSYTTFAVCTLAILSGLGLTLTLLAMYEKALPALPLSILMGVVYYLYTRYVIEPWIHGTFVHQTYA